MRNYTLFLHLSQAVNEVLVIVKDFILELIFQYADVGAII